MLAYFVEYITLKYFKDYETKCKELVIIFFHELLNDSYSYVYVVTLIITSIHNATYIYIYIYMCVCIYIYIYIFHMIISRVLCIRLTSWVGVTSK
jgi:hypothetical protein